MAQRQISQDFHSLILIWKISIFKWCKYYPLVFAKCSLNLTSFAPLHFTLFPFSCEIKAIFNIVNRLHLTINQLQKNLLVPYYTMSVFFLFPIFPLLKRIKTYRVTDSKAEKINNFKKSSIFCHHHEMFYRYFLQ